MSRRPPANQPRELKIAMSWFPFTANEDKSNPLVLLLSESMQCDIDTNRSPIKITADFGTSYDKTVLKLLTGEYSFGIVPPFTFLQCVQGATPDYAKGICLDLQLTDPQREGLSRCRVIGQKQRPPSGMASVEQWSYHPVLVTNLAFREPEDKSPRAASRKLRWEMLHGKTILLGSRLSTSSNIVPRLALIENGITDVHIQAEMSRDQAIATLRSDTLGDYAAFLADDDYQRGGFGSPELRVFPVERRIPFDPMVTCDKGAAEDAQPRERVLEKMRKVGLIRTVDAWNYPVFQRYIYTAPLGNIQSDGRATFGFLESWTDRRALRQALVPHSTAKVLCFEPADDGATDVATERRCGTAQIEKVTGDFGEANLSRDALMACNSGGAICHLDI